MWQHRNRYIYTFSPTRCIQFFCDEQWLDVWAFNAALLRKYPWFKFHNVDLWLKSVGRSRDKNQRHIEMHQTMMRSFMASYHQTFRHYDYLFTFPPDASTITRRRIRARLRMAQIWIQILSPKYQEGEGSQDGEHLGEHPGTQVWEAEQELHAGSDHMLQTGEGLDQGS